MLALLKMFRQFHPHNTRSRHSFLSSRPKRIHPLVPRRRPPIIIPSASRARPTGTHSKETQSLGRRLFDRWPQVPQPIKHCVRGLEKSKRRFVGDVLARPNGPSRSHVGSQPWQGHYCGVGSSASPTRPIGHRASARAKALGHSACSASRHSIRDRVLYPSAYPPDRRSAFRSGKQRPAESRLHV